MEFLAGGGVLLLVILFGAISFVISRYRICPSNKAIVVYGKTGTAGSAKCIHKGGVFVWPLIQDYAVLSLQPMDTDVKLEDVFTKDRKKVTVATTFTFAISTNPKLLQNAAERLLICDKFQIITMASHIIYKEIDVIIALSSIEEIAYDRKEFIEKIDKNVETELNKLGLTIISTKIKSVINENN